VATLASGANNTAVGYQAGYSNTTGAGLTFLGYQAGYSNQTGASNTFIGYQNSGYGAGYFNTTGSSNVGVGSAALALNTTAMEILVLVFRLDIVIKQVFF
jgi:hypothetical protein